MPLQEINFDGLIGPTHNYAGLSPGNLASALNAGKIAFPRAAALQGIAKMQANLALGLTQGLFLPQDRPDQEWLEQLGENLTDAEPHMRAAAWSASSMWAANAATVSPAPDTKDGKCHLTVANLMTMPHRSHEWSGTLKQLQIAFAAASFRVHGPILPPFGDEGAANHIRLCHGHGTAGIEIFVYGKNGGAYPVRQHIEAGKAISRIHGLDPARTLFVQQSEKAIAAGAFHNDVVAVANEHVLFAHELAFADKGSFYVALRTLLPQIEIIEVPAKAVSLADAVKSYLFNAQLVSLPDGGMALILPTEAQDTPAVWNWLGEMVKGNGPIRRLIPVDVRQSMANGGGPACLRLRVVADPADIDPRFLADREKLDGIAILVDRYWPEQIAPADLENPALIAIVRQARKALIDHLDLARDLSGTSD
ncbi:N-succinylarginine dihydrolase [Rhizorhapis sp. SPR117]|uniref:N-succinylarginine dihydrolase n=1 Tax=Rhizorhapis sp. SPR117 TaxID=2912611 RepID=UPI001F19F65C|nr:N-succinylarginine dihydrolase [Rhizorhapis sp. SPR117]